jgi:hypothetical protein
MVDECVRRCRLLGRGQFGSWVALCIGEMDAGMDGWVEVS